MAFKDTIFRLAATLVLENPSRRKTISELRGTLERSHARLNDRLGSRAANPTLLRHVIAIERWGQTRLRVALGEVALSPDRSGTYAPDAALGWTELRATFDATRRETLEIAHRLEGLSTQPAPVPHDQFGPISVKAWLRYLDTHASAELSRLRSA
jgi:hypothetical protein